MWRENKNNSNSLFPVFRTTRRSFSIAVTLFGIYALSFLASLIFSHFDSAPWNSFLSFITNPDKLSTTIFSIENLKILLATTAKNEYGTSFWVTQLNLILLAVALPYLRLIRASVLTVLSVALIFLLAFYTSPIASEAIFQPGLITVGALFSVFVILSFYGELKDHRQLTDIFSQYIPPELAKRYAENPDAINLKGESRDISVMFCDIRGFSSISERMSPTELAEWLNEFFSMASEIIVRYRGTIDKYMGDCIMAFWGAPISNPDHASAALEAAMEIQRQLVSMNERFTAEGRPAIEVGIGLNSGETNVGNIGSVYRMAYTVIGDTVNIAERLEGQTKNYKVPIIVSKVTATLIPSIYFRELDITRVKGKKRYVRIFEPVCNKLEATPQIKQHLSLHRKAIKHYRQRNYDKAERLFRILLRLRPDDFLYGFYLDRIARKSKRRVS